MIGYLYLSRTKRKDSVRYMRKLSSLAKQQTEN